MDNLTIIIIMITVLIVIPIIFARMSGKNPMEIFFGSRVNDSAFGKKDNPESTTGKGAKKTEKNSNKNDLLNTLSSLANYTRRNRFYLIVPGTLEYGGKMANLAAIIITRRGVIGVNCFGYGGKIVAGSGKDDWTQTLNGEKTKFGSPVAKNEEQAKILKSVLDAEGLGDIEYRVIGVFTAPNVQLSGARSSHCYNRDSLREFLASDACMVSHDITPKEVGDKLGPYIKRQK